MLFHWYILCSPKINAGTQVNSIGLTLAQRHLSVEKLTAARGKVNAYVGKTKAKRLTLADVSAKVSAIIDKKQR